MLYSLTPLAEPVLLGVAWGAPPSSRRVHITLCCAGKIVGLHKFSGALFPPSLIHCLLRITALLTTVHRPISLETAELVYVTVIKKLIDV